MFPCKYAGWRHIMDPIANDLNRLASCALNPRQYCTEINIIVHTVGSGFSFFLSTVWGQSSSFALSKTVIGTVNSCRGI